VIYHSGHRENYGGFGGTEREVFWIQDGEELVGISGKVGNRVDSIQFHTSLGRSSPRYGGRGGTETYSAEIPAGATLLGFHGRHASRIDKIGLVWWEGPATTTGPR
jgi:hypothetical protein